MKSFRFAIYFQKELIIKEGFHVQDEMKWFILDKGECCLTKGHPAHPSEGGKLLCRYQKRGDHFGEDSILREEARSKNVVALTQTTVIALDSRTFLRLVDDWKWLRKHLEDQIKKFEDQYESILLNASNQHNRVSRSKGRRGNLHLPPVVIEDRNNKVEHIKVQPKESPPQGDSDAPASQRTSGYQKQRRATGFNAKFNLALLETSTDSDG